MKKRTIYILFGILLLINTGMFFYFNGGRQNIYYVDLQKLYAEFELKKELETSLTNYVHQNTQELDSLAMTINQLKYRIDENKTERDIMLFEQLGQLYVTKETNFKQERSNLSQQYDDQIWKQLNQYIKDYAAEHHCDFMMGGNGDGSVMYAKPSKDVTEDMIAFVNEKYNGK